MDMEITIAYHQLAKTYRKYTYTPNNGRLVYNNHWSWLVVFEALNKTNFAAVKYYNGQYETVEL